MTMHSQESHDHLIIYNENARTPNTRRGRKCPLLWQLRMTTTINDWHHIRFHLRQLFLRLYNPWIKTCVEIAKMPWYTYATPYASYAINDKDKCTHNPPLTNLGHLHHLLDRISISMSQGLSIVRHETFAVYFNTLFSSMLEFNFYKSNYDLHHLHIACHNTLWSTPYNTGSAILWAVSSEQ